MAEKTLTIKKYEYYSIDKCSYEEITDLISNKTEWKR